MAESNNVETVLQKQLTITYGGDEFIFRIPSMKDRMRIYAEAAKLRADSAADGNGISLGFDPNATSISNQIATFTVLLASTSAKWVYTPGPTGAHIDLERWPDDAPVAEVIDQFYNELETFRKKGNRPEG